MTSLSRRELIKSSIAATTAAAAGIPVSTAALAQGAAAESGWRWDKAVCRMCGTGCGIQVATAGGKVVATKGDPAASVNRGLLCVKGYYNGKMMAGADRLTQPLLRMKDGKFDKTGAFSPVSWDVAFDEMERQFRKQYAAKGPTGVAIMGSGQYTIPEGYAAAKLMKAGFRSNNIDPNARHCMASAVAAFMQVFGIDEPANCYDDIELADTFVLCGANPAEAHPVLWGRITDRKLSHKPTRIFNITTYANMTSDIADVDLVIKPNADLALLNYVAREIVARNAVNWAFVDKHCVFAAGAVDIGYGMRPTTQFALPAERDTVAKEMETVLDRYEAVGQRRTPGQSVKQVDRNAAGKHWLISFDEYRKGIEPYTLDFVAELAKGDPDETLDSFKAKMKLLADAYCGTGDKARNILSCWTMGVNQHQRGTWVNTQLYALHLLLGKHGIPGNGAFSLTGQPSACGTAREVGTFAHRLPADMMVANPTHRAKAEKVWGLPAKTINPKDGADHLGIMRGLEDGSIGFLWVQVTNPFQSTPNLDHWNHAAREKDNFIVVADVYPTVSCKVADLVLPAAFMLEKWGLYGNAERRTQAWRQQVDPPGQARTDLWMLLEFSRRFRLRDVWAEKPLPGLKADGYADDRLPDVMADAAKLGYTPDSTLYDVLFARPENKAVAWPDPVARGHANATVQALGESWFPEKALFDEYRQFTLDHHDLAPFDVYHADAVRGLRWPVRQNAAGAWQETRWRFSEGNDPYVKPGAGFDFYGPALKALPSGSVDAVTDAKPTAIPGKAKIFFRPYAAPVEQPDAHYDLWLTTGRILEHWHTGSMTRRVPELHRAQPAVVMYMHPADAQRRGLSRNDVAWVESRRGKVQVLVETQGRNKVPKGTVSVAFFDENVLINRLVLDALDPISREPDFKKCAARVYKA